jgi:hypothetical protein
MPLNLFTPIDDPIGAPEGKFTALFLAQLRKIRWSDDEIAGHDAIALPVCPMANRAVALIFKLAAGNDFSFLRPGWNWYDPEQDSGDKSGGAFGPGFYPRHYLGVHWSRKRLNYSKAEQMSRFMASVASWRQPFWGLKSMARAPKGDEITDKLSQG